MLARRWPATNSPASLTGGADETALPQPYECADGILSTAQCRAPWRALRAAASWPASGGGCVTRRRVFGTVRRLPSGRWQARYRAPDGVLLTAPRTFTTKLDANRYLAEIETTQVAGSWRDPRRAEISLRAYAESWIIERTVRGRPLARRTQDTYRNSLDRWILPFLGDEQLGKITAPVVRNWHSRLCEVAGPTAKRQAYSLLRAILNTAVDDDILHRNPCRVKGAGQPVAAERPLLDLGQVERINDHMPAHLQTLVTVAF